MSMQTWNHSIATNILKECWWIKTIRRLQIDWMKLTLFRGQPRHGLQTNWWNWTVTNIPIKVPRVYAITESFKRSNLKVVVEHIFLTTFEWKHNRMPDVRVLRKSWIWSCRKERAHQHWENVLKYEENTIFLSNWRISHMIKTIQRNLSLNILIPSRLHCFEYFPHSDLRNSWNTSSIAPLSVRVVHCFGALCTTLTHIKSILPSSRSNTSEFTVIKQIIVRQKEETYQWSYASLLAYNGRSGGLKLYRLSFLKGRRWGSFWKLYLRREKVLVVHELKTLAQGVSTGWRASSDGLAQAAANGLTVNILTNLPIHYLDLSEKRNLRGASP